MSTTPRLALPLLAAGQAQKHVTHNDALMRLDALIHLVVASRSLAAPPSSPAETAAYIVPAGGTGLFAGKAGQIAIFEDGGWSFLPPNPGWQAWVGDEAAHRVWTGTEWRAVAAGSGAELWGVNTTADTVSRLTVAADASLFDHDGTDHRLKINKQAASRTASLIFQSALSGRAEMGLAGDDQFRIKVSGDGSAWTEALAIDRATGAVSMPATAWARESPQPNLLINGDWQINQRGFAGGALAAGAFGFDRWRAHTGGATLSRSGFDLTLAAGTVEQVVEPALWGHASFASVPLCLSVEGLSDGNLSVGVGSATGSITPGSGRRALALTPGAGDTGPLVVRLAPASGAVSFRRIKLELGSIASPWLARGLAAEHQLCARYHWRPGATLLLDCYQAASALFQQPMTLPTPMRNTPGVSFTVSSEANILAGERAISAVSPGMAVLGLRAASTGRAYAEFAGIAFDAEF